MYFDLKDDISSNIELISQTNNVVEFKHNIKPILLRHYSHSFCVFSRRIQLYQPIV